MSLRARLLVGIGFVAFVLSVVALVVSATTRAELIDQVDRRLESLDGPGDRRPRDAADAPRGPAEIFEAQITSGGYLEVATVERNGASVSSPDLDLDDLRSGAGHRFLTVDSRDGSTTYRVLIDREQGRVTIYGVPIDDVRTTIRRLVVLTLIGSAAILAALGLVAWWVLRLGIRPIKDMTATAGRIADGDYEVRLPETDERTESGQLAIALNRMVGNITESLDARTRSEEKVRQFVADASHELRTPVTTIRGYAELYRMGGLARPEALDDAMRRTEQEAARMGRLVEDMLTLARLDEQRPLDRRPVDLAVLATDAVADARASSPGRPVDVETTGPAIVVGDEDRLRQVVANVVGNALVHTDADVPVTLRVGRTGSEVWLEVADRGVGMTPDVAARVTERFFRADPARAHRGGSGLGLSIVDAAVSAHGGQVVVTSTPGVGTTVRLAFPAGAPATV